MNRTHAIISILSVDSSISFNSLKFTFCFLFNEDILSSENKSFPFSRLSILSWPMLMFEIFCVCLYVDFFLVSFTLAFLFPFCRLCMRSTSANSSIAKTTKNNDTSKYEPKSLSFVAEGLSDYKEYTKTLQSYLGYRIRWIITNEAFGNSFCFILPFRIWRD